MQKVIDVNLTSHFWVKQIVFVFRHIGYNSLITQTVRTFLDTMIEKKRGHIVAISSLGGKISFPIACAYVATKFGVKGFMNALYDELCVDNSDEYVKTTCVFPSFINTRKELSDVLDQTTEMVPKIIAANHLDGQMTISFDLLFQTPRMSPKYVADCIVDGMLLNRQNISVPSSINLLTMVKYVSLI